MIASAACLASSVFASTLEWSATLKSTEVRDQPSDSSAVVLTLPLATRVRVTKWQGDWAEVDTGMVRRGRPRPIVAWVHSDAIAGLAQFKRVTAWQRPRRIHIERGNFASTYQLRANGDFSIASRYSGHLYRAGNGIFARKTGSEDFGDLFFLTPAGELCWGENAEQCAR